MGMSMNDQSQKSPLQIWKDSHNVISLPESEGGPLHSSWLEYQQALNSGQAHHLASRLALPVSLSDLTTSGTLPQHFSGSSESASLNCCLESRLRQQLESTGSILYSLTWKTKATPAGRQYCQRAASVPRTNAIDFSLVRTTWPTPKARDHHTEGKGKFSPSLARVAESIAAWPTPTTRDHKDGKECLNVPTNSLLGREVWKASWGTPTVQNSRHGSYSEAETKRDPNNLHNQCYLVGSIRITASGQMLTGSDAGMESTGQLNPAHSRWLMGFPPEWDVCAVTVMPSSRRSPQNSSKPSLVQQQSKKVRIRAGSFEHDGWLYGNQKAGN